MISFRLTAGGDGMMNLVRSCTLILFMAGWAAAVPSENRLVWRTGEMVLVFDQRIQSMAEDVNRYYPAIKQELVQTFGWSLKEQPTVVLVSERDDFRRILPNPLFIAVAFPSRQTIVIDTTRVQTGPHNLRITLAHELAHLLLHQHIDSVHLPRWLDEGVCQWFTGGVAEILADRHRPILGQALGSGESIDLAELSQRFPSDQRGLMLAYEQSRDIVTLVANRYGAESLIGILNRMKAGQPIDVSFQDQLGISVAELEIQWQRQLSGGVIWWGRVAAHLDTILFSLAAILTVGGFMARRMRRKAVIEDEEDNGGLD